MYGIRLELSTESDFFFLNDKSYRLTGYKPVTATLPIAL